MIIPFFIPHAGCPHQCVFCNQNHISGKNTAAEAANIPVLMRSYLDSSKHKGPVEVAFYGGSFTALPISRQLTFLQAVQPFIQAGEVSTIRLSTRPDCITREVLDLLERHHVSIVELGAQSMDDEVLSAAGRGHIASDTVHAAALLQERGFILGLQLMPGLPGDTAERFINTVEEVVRIKPGFVRLYPAIVIRDTPLARLYKEGRYAPLTLDEAVAWCSNAALRFKDAGIAVIRVGLQATESLLQPGMILAGPFHQAFGQLVESALYLRKMRELLASRQEASPSAVIAVHTKDLSTAIGQRRMNIETLKSEFNMREVLVRSNNSILVRGNPVFVPER